jgi:Protein of unknown function (DUF3040)
MGFTPMLSEHEQRELAAIEDTLLRDPALSACFHEEPPLVGRRVLRPSCLMVPGIVIAFAASVLGLGAVLAQGLGLIILGLVWWIATSAVARRRARRSITYCIESFKRSWFPPTP